MVVFMVISIKVNDMINCILGLFGNKKNCIWLLRNNV